MSTINRTFLSKLLTIQLAESILKWVPEGTHDHSKYVTPEEMHQELTDVGCRVLNMRGLHLHPLGNRWELSAWKGPCELAMNYILVAQKNASDPSSAQ